MNLSTVYTNLVRELAMAFTVGDQIVFSGVVSVNITAVGPKPAGSNVKIESVRKPIKKRIHLKILKEGVLDCQYCK